MRGLPIGSAAAESQRQDSASRGVLRESSGALCTPSWDPEEQVRIPGLARRRVDVSSARRRPPARAAPAACPLRPQRAEARYPASQFIPMQAACHQQAHALVHFGCCRHGSAKWLGPGSHRRRPSRALLSHRRQRGACAGSPPEALPFLSRSDCSDRSASVPCVAMALNSEPCANAATRPAITVPPSCCLARPASAVCRLLRAGQKQDLHCTALTLTCVWRSTEAAGLS